MANADGCAIAPAKAARSPISVPVEFCRAIRSPKVIGGIDFLISSCIPLGLNDVHDFLEVDVIFEGPKHVFPGVGRRAELEG
jgi:hypothetical protein